MVTVVSEGMTGEGKAEKELWDQQRETQQQQVSNWQLAVNMVDGGPCAQCFERRNFCIEHACHDES
jgi:Pyruvate/2-oxoacid:ferredoxin oxidoreductase delta subunit